MFFILSAEKPFEKCPRNNGFATISESLALILIIFVLLTNKQLFSPLQYKLKQNFFIVTVKLVEYFFSAVNVISSNLYARPSSRIKISFFLLLTCTEELIYTPQIIKLHSNSAAENEKVPYLSIPIPYPEYLYSSISESLVNLTVPNKQLVNVILSCFK